jgi:hypothetical protein
MPRQISRGAFLAAGAVAALFPARAALAAALPEGDLASLRLLVGVELLTLDFSSSHPGYKQMHADDTAHYNGLVNLLGTSGVTAATPGDVDFTYPKKAQPAQLARTLKALSVGAYAGALENVQSPAIRLPLAQILVNESQQLASLTGAVGHAFGPALTVAAVSSALDEYES